MINAEPNGVGIFVKNGKITRKGVWKESQFFREIDASNKELQAVLSEVMEFYHEKLNEREQKMQTKKENAKEKNEDESEKESESLEVSKPKSQRKRKVKKRQK